MIDAASSQNSVSCNTTLHKVKIPKVDPIIKLRNGPLHKIKISIFWLLEILFILEIAYTVGTSV